MIQWRQLSLFDLFSSSTSSPLPPSAPQPALRMEARARLRRGWSLEWKRGGEARLYVPTALLQAPGEIFQALREWCRLARGGRRFRAQTAPARRELEKTVHAWFEMRQDQDPGYRKRVSLRSARQMARLNARGRHHDLEAILARVNADYFGGALQARITWSPRWGGVSTQSVRGDAEGKPYHLITVSRGYDHPSATAEIVGGVVYHECLHAALPPQESGGRRIVHGREFRRREKEYRHYEAWRRWHREVLPRVLRRSR